MRWSYGTWVMAAVAMDEFGDVCPLSELNNRTNLRVAGYYQEPRFYGDPYYYKMADLTGENYSKYEGFFDIEAHVQIKDTCGGTKTMEAACEGYTCCGENCYMLLILNLGKDAASTTMEFQKVDLTELQEAVGKQNWDRWEAATRCSSDLVKLNGPTF